MNTKKINVALVEDDAGTREKLMAVINASAMLRCQLACSSGEEALVVIPKNTPDVVLMDINLPRMNGI